VRPPVLANTTMESFVQPTSTCMGCHASARTVNPFAFVSSDFSFTLNNARPAPSNPNVIAPPRQPVTDWDRQNWDAVMRGYRLATQTYELLPTHVPQARLHCSSCHLNAGGNRAAAWWVNLSREYPRPPDLQNRINGCFERSLNGKPLCTPRGYPTPGDPPSCETSADMHALTAYMDWLTAQWNDPHTTTHGFPPISPLSGDVARGEHVYTQKCAVCHGADGQGRYDHGIYYRPALWGPSSFNHGAGMFAAPPDLAAFVRWNMPLGAGGLLTDQEAWDVEAFIHSKPRPRTPPSRSDAGGTK
jgi:cytochrome c